MKRFLLLIFCLALSYSVEYFAAYFTRATLDTWYVTIVKPSWNPPNYLFPIVWTLLYTLMGVSSFLIIDCEKRLFSCRMNSYFFQLFCNFLWPISFFFLQSPALGLVNILVLLLAIAYNIKTFYAVKPLAAYLLLPYFLWVLYATSLNVAIVYLNA